MKFSKETIVTDKKVAVLAILEKHKKISVKASVSSSSYDFFFKKKSYFGGAQDA